MTSTPSTYMCERAKAELEYKTLHLFAGVLQLLRVDLGCGRQLIVIGSKISLPRNTMPHI